MSLIFGAYDNVILKKCTHFFPAVAAKYGFSRILWYRRIRVQSSAIVLYHDMMTQQKYYGNVLPETEKKK